MRAVITSCAPGAMSMPGCCNNCRSLVVPFIRGPSFARQMEPKTLEHFPLRFLRLHVSSFFLSSSSECKRMHEKSIEGGWGKRYSKALQGRTPWRKQELYSCLRV